MKWKMNPHKVPSIILRQKRNRGSIVPKRSPKQPPRFQVLKNLCRPLMQRELLRWLLKKRRPTQLLQRRPPGLLLQKRRPIQPLQRRPLGLLLQEKRPKQLLQKRRPKQPR